MSNASLPANLRARVVPIIKILDGSESEPIEGKSGRVYGLSGNPGTAERCTVFPHKQTTPAQVEQWLKDVDGGALDDIFQVPFRRFGAFVPAFRLEILAPDISADPVLIVAGQEFGLHEFFGDTTPGHAALLAWMKEKGLVLDEPQPFVPQGAGQFNPELAKDDAALQKLADECGAPSLGSINPAPVACSEGTGEPMTEGAKEELREELAKDAAVDDSPDEAPPVEFSDTAKSEIMEYAAPAATAPRRPGRPPKAKP